jgi:hypothetical protein
MVSRLNPAWQRKSASSSRLAEISARSRDDAQAATQGNEVCRAIPFLLDTGDQQWITDELSRILTERGHPCTLCGPGEVTQADRNSAAPQASAASTSAAYCLLSTTSPATLLESGVDHVVLPVPANLDGIRLAYQRIKLFSQHATPEIGIVLVGPRDQHAAWRYFRKLAVATLRYLDVPLLNLGFLPEQVGPGQEAEASHGHHFLTRISERLLHSGFYSTLNIARAQKDI